VSGKLNRKDRLLDKALVHDGSVKGAIEIKIFPNVKTGARDEIIVKC